MEEEMFILSYLRGLPKTYLHREMVIVDVVLGATPILWPPVEVELFGPVDVAHSPARNRHQLSGQVNLYCNKNNTAKLLDGCLFDVRCRLYIWTTSVYILVGQRSFCVQMIITSISK